MCSESFPSDLFLNPYEYYPKELSLDDSVWVPNNLEEYPIMTDWHDNEMPHFRNKPISNWNMDDYLCYFCNEATHNNRNYEEINLQNFSNITCDKIKNMSLDDLVQLCESSEDGELFYKSKENLFKERPFDCFTNQNETPLHRDLLPDCPDESLSRLSTSSGESSTFEPPAPVRKGPGRPKSSHAIRKKPEKRLGKVWEFLRNLLLDEKTCPSLIKWDNFNEGTFKFVQSEKVAKLWGARKKNDKMNYEKLSRAMRYYYRSQVLLPVVGKRLVYKFGPQAEGWKTENPIL